MLPGGKHNFPKFTPDGPRGKSNWTTTLQYVRAYRGEFTFETGHDAMKALFDRDDPPTAVFCANDVIALGACSAARGMGLTIPQDVSVVGFDDIPMSSWELTDLTTVRCELPRLASTAAELLVTRLAQPELEIRRVVLEPELVRRGSLVARRT